MEHAFVALVDAEKPTLDPVEHDAWQWCSYGETMALLVWPSNKAALKVAHGVVVAWGQGEETP